MVAVVVTGVEAEYPVGLMQINNQVEAVQRPTQSYWELRLGREVPYFSPILLFSPILSYFIQFKVPI